MDSIYVERNGVTNHWGIWVDKNQPITGVINNYFAEWLTEESIYNSIDLDLESHITECSECQNDQYCEAMEYWEYSDTFLLGDWILDTNTGLYEPDPQGDYSAIYHVDSNTTQVVYSKYLKKCALCSPCYPGQGDLDTTGDYLAYDLPPELY